MLNKRVTSTAKGVYLKGVYLVHEEGRAASRGRSGLPLCESWTPGHARFAARPRELLPGQTVNMSSPSKGEAMTCPRCRHTPEHTSPRPRADVLVMRLG